jgi:alanine dehydrogenase
MSKQAKSKTKPATSAATLTQEKAKLVSTGRKSLQIGIPKEPTSLENRVSLSPEAVAVLVSRGLDIVVESKAGVHAKFSDDEYSDAGAQIVYSPAEAFSADIVLKVYPATLEEIELLKPGKALISTLNPGNLEPTYLDALENKKVTAVAFEFIEDKVGGKPVVRAMSEIAGNSVMLVAAEYLSAGQKGKGIIVGGITGVPPTKVVLLGAGTVAEYAARTALGLGAEVKVFDNHIYKLRRLKHELGQQIYTSTMDETTLANAIEEADIVVGSLAAEKGITPCVVTEDMVANMKPDSIIIDVSIDQGGCFETSQPSTYQKPTYRKFDVIHYCVPNIASRVPRTASLAFSHIFTPLLSRMGDLGGVDEMIFDCNWFMRGVYTYRGTITHEHLAKKFNKKYRDLKLIMTARN